MSETKDTTSGLPPRWRVKRVNKIAAIDQRGKREVPDDAEVVFVPKAAVGEEFGGIQRPEVQRNGEVCLS